MSDNAAVLAELGRISGEIKGVLDSQTTEIKKHGETSTKTAEKLGTLEAKYEQLQQDVKAKIEELEAKSKRLGMDLTEQDHKSAGQQFTEADGFKNARDQGGHVRLRVEMKALTGAADSVGSLVQPQRLSTYTPPSEALRIRNLFAQGRTNSNALEFPQIKTWTNNAAAVPDSPTSAVLMGAGGLKPESELVTEDVVFPVRTIAHLLRAHKNILDDAPALRSLIDEKLLSGLDTVVDTQLLKGDGTGNNVKGVLASSRVFTRAVAGDKKPDVLRRALTDLRVKNYRADAFILNPFDWEDIELIKGTDGKYVWSVVPDGAVPRLWRTPVIDTTAIDQGQFLTGAFREAGMVFDRMQSAVEVFEQDRDNVPRNLVTFRAETRLALVIFDQNAFVKGTYVTP